MMYALRTQLTWTPLRSTMRVKDKLVRSFYIEICHLEHWDTRTLDKKIEGQLYAHIAISRKPEKVIKQEFYPIKNDCLKNCNGLLLKSITQNNCHQTMND